MKKYSLNKFIKNNLLIVLAFVNLTQLTSRIVAQENTIGVTDITWDSTEGFTIFSSGTRTFIINNCGQLIKEWESENRVSNSAYLLENGDLIRTGSVKDFGYFFGGIIERFNWDGDLIWSFEINNDDYIQHHDIEPMPNGNILALCYNFKEPIDAWNAGAMDTLEYWSTSIFELEPLENNQANIVWEWHLWDHLIQKIDSTRLNYQIGNHPELFDINRMYFPNDSIIPTLYVDVGPDWMHMNSIDYNEDRDEILVSSRDHNEVFIIDHSTNSSEAAGHSGGEHNMGGDFVYRFGHNEFYGQHDAHWVNRPDFDENAIIVFNNGFRHDESLRGYSSVDLFVPQIDTNGKYKHFEVDTFEVLLKLDDPEREYSEIMGSAQILDNNRILICNSTRRWFIEFDTTRNIKWRYVSPITSSGSNYQGNPTSSPVIFRAKKLPQDHLAFENNWTIGDPIELNFNIDSCLGITPISTTYITPEVKFYPNPSNQFLFLESNQTIKKLILYNTFGQIYTPKAIHENKWDIQHTPNGFYTVVIFNDEGEKYASKLVIQH